MAFTLTITGNGASPAEGPAGVDYENTVMAAARDFLAELLTNSTLSDAVFVGDATGTTHMLGEVST